MGDDPSHRRTPTASGQYFAEHPEPASRRRVIELVLPDLRLELVTDRGVFSTDTVDTGTRLLLRDAARPPATGNLVDLGCGYGPIALALATRAPAATVWAVDVNERALTLCAENARRAGLTNVRVGDPPAGTEIAAIYSNPPIRVGKNVLHEMLRAWLGRLDMTGRAELVVHKHLGADSLARWLETEGYTVVRLASLSGYRLLAVEP